MPSGKSQKRSHTRIVVGDIVRINTSPDDRLFLKLGLVIEEAEPFVCDELIDISNSDEMYFSILVEGRCYMYGNYEVLRISQI